MSLLTIVQDAADMIGLVRPSSAIGSSDPQIRRLVSLSNRDGAQIARRHDWQALQVERTFTATATTTQTGALPAGFDRMIPKSMWNRTQSRRVVGPLSPQRWQQMLSGLTAMPLDTFRIRGSDLLMSPSPTAGDTIAFEYISRYWCGGAASTAPTQAAWLADTDVPYFDATLMTVGLAWRFKQSIGTDYGEEFTEYESRLASLASHDGGLLDLEMGGGESSVVSDPYVADGSWSIT